jgi:hypothetical protein
LLEGRPGHAEPSGAIDRAVHRVVSRFIVAPVASAARDPALAGVYVVGVTKLSERAASGVYLRTRLCAGTDVRRVVLAVSVGVEETRLILTLFEIRECLFEISERQIAVYEALGLDVVALAGERVAYVADQITVAVGLIKVRSAGAVVGVVGDAICVRVDRRFEHRAGANPIDLAQECLSPVSINDVGRTVCEVAQAHDPRRITNPSECVTSFDDTIDSQLDAAGAVAYANDVPRSVEDGASAGSLDLIKRGDAAHGRERELNFPGATD